jgi:hypothetical protein
VELSPIPLFGLGNYSRSRPVNDQRRVNLYSEISEDPERGSKITLYSPPGLTGFTNYGANPTRGAYSHGDYKYYVNRDTLWKEANDGTRTNVGTLLTTGGKVGMRDNGAQLMIVDGTYGYIFTFATDTLAQIVDAGFPANPTSVAYLNLRFGVTSEGTGQYQWSAINDGMSWDALDFATEESNPDDLVRMWDENGQFILFGPVTTGFAGATPNGDAAFGSIGASAIEFGLAARWSVCKFDDSIIFLSKNRLGGVQVSTLSGYTRQTVSTADIESIFSKYSGVENATAFSFRVDGHSFCQFSFPSEDKTWRYDGKTREWTEVESDGGRHRAELHISHQGNSYVTDFEDGNTYLFDPEALTDNGATIERQWVGRHLVAGNRTRIAELWIDMEVGVGLTTGQGVDPQLMMRMSKDGGQTWGAARWASFGALGAYKTRATFRRLGMSNKSGDYLFEFTVTDPVKVVFTGAWGGSLNGNPTKAPR